MSAAKGNLKYRCATMVCAMLLAGAYGCASSDEQQVHAKPAPPAQPAIREQTPAEEAFEAGSKRPPTAKTLYALSQLMTTQGKTAQAEALLRKIIAVKPDFMPAYCDLAESQVRQRRIEDAISTLSAGLKVSPKQTILLNDRGMAFMLLRNYSAALKDFTTATAIAPDDARYRSNMAVALGMMGRYEESLAVYRQVLPEADARHNVQVLRDARGDLKPVAVQPKIETPAAPVVAKVEIVEPAPVQVAVLAASTEAPLEQSEVIEDQADEQVAAVNLPDELMDPHSASTDEIVPDEEIAVAAAIDDIAEFQPATSSLAAESQDVDSETDAAADDSAEDESTSEDIQ